ncbi:MAG: MBL fold metallo-hydrolase [Chloroflexi bacterium]|nr:MBL fold metallo-hydrolase [Chloroflexota bacterium]MCI0646985.1 MBL fold metallo-hydrolase [Chloroflexota bacterium]MCI0729256.1 MBL fold metallo-hydrolase [Chloroflexota bacterium]
MVRERIADDIYVFTSRRYAQVTAGAILTKEGVILIDTLFYPDETQAIKDFLEGRLGLKVRYIINTHYHADHTLGTYLFPEAQVVSHTLCRQFLNSTGRAGLEQMKSQSPEFDKVEVVLPDLIFEDGFLNVHLGGKMVRLQHCPGHSLDLICALVVNDRILFASDTVMPVPTLFDGSYDYLVRSLQEMLDMNLDCVVQGHGEVILRGEVESLIRSDLAYLNKIKRAVENVIERGKPFNALEKVSIESCGKSRIPLNGFVADLHQANLRRLYEDLNNNHQSEPA